MSGNAVPEVKPTVKVFRGDGFVRYSVDTGAHLYEAFTYPDRPVRFGEDCTPTDHIGNDLARTAILREIEAQEKGTSASIMARVDDLAMLADNLGEFLRDAARAHNYLAAALRGWDESTDEEKHSYVSIALDRLRGIH